LKPEKNLNKQFMEVLPKNLQHKGKIK